MLLTTYDYVIRDKGPLSKVEWKYLIIDEGMALELVPIARLGIESMCLQLQYSAAPFLIVTGICWSHCIVCVVLRLNTGCGF